MASVWRRSWLSVSSAAAPESPAPWMLRGEILRVTLLTPGCVSIVCFLNQAVTSSLLKVAAPSSIPQPDSYFPPQSFY